MSSKFLFTDMQQFGNFKYFGNFLALNYNINLIHQNYKSMTNPVVFGSS